MSPPFGGRWTPPVPTLCSSSTGSPPSPRIDFQQDAWGVDLAVSGSQKGFMMPPGLALLGVSRKALEAHAALGEGGGMERCYFSFADMVAANDTGYFPLHTADSSAARAPGVAGPAAGRRSPAGLRTSPPAGRGGPARRRRARTRPVRHRLGVGVRHGLGDPRPRRRRQQRRRAHRLPALPHVVRGGPVEGGRQGVPDRTPRRLQRGDVPDRTGRCRDLAQRRRRQGRARRGRRRGPDLLPRATSNRAS